MSNGSTKLKGVLEVHCSSSTRLARPHNKLEHGKSNVVLLQKYIDLHFLMRNNVSSKEYVYLFLSHPALESSDLRVAQEKKTA